MFLSLGCSFLPHVGNCMLVFCSTLLTLAVKIQEHKNWGILGNLKIPRNHGFKTSPKNKLPNDYNNMIK